MTNIPPSSSSAVPSIRILGADDASALFDSSEMFATDLYNFCNFISDDPNIYVCPPGLQAEYISANDIPHSSADLEDIPELSHLITMNQPPMTGYSYSHPYPTILRDPSTATSGDGLSPSSLGSPVPSPTSSFGSSLSPSSIYTTIGLSDGELPLPPSPATSDQHFLWPPQGSNRQSNDSLVLHPFMGSFSDDSVPLSSMGLQTGSRRPRSTSTPSSRVGPVASKAMLEANSRRRRHPAQHECPDCGQTFTALFSLKRHAQSHTGERPFACGIPGCTQRFFNSSDCKRHEKSRKRHKDI